MRDRASDRTVMFRSPRTYSADEAFAGFGRALFGLALLKQGKSFPRENPDEAAKDRIDFVALSRVPP